MTVEELIEYNITFHQIYSRKCATGRLRTGYTTGTSATASTKGALYSLITGEPMSQVTVSLPKGGTIALKIAWTKKGEKDDSKVTCAVIKDGGDDPDATHGAGDMLNSVVQQ